MDNGIGLRGIFKQNALRDILSVARVWRHGMGLRVRHSQIHPAWKGCAFYGKQPWPDQQGVTARPQ
jgi:hypothetical protein